MKSRTLSTKKSALQKCISKNNTPSQIYCYAKKENAYKYNQLRKLHSCGNTKLPKTTFIFNMGDCHNCPSAKLGLCNFRKNCSWQKIEKDTCYGLKAEIIYPDCLPYRIRQKSYWLTVSSDQFIADFSAIQEKKRNKFTLVRFNEGSDFHSQYCVDKAEKIAIALEKKYGIACHTYTHRTDLNFSGVSCLNVLNSTANHVKGLNASYIAITAKQMINVRADKFRSIYGTLAEGKYFDNIYFCPSSCKKCTLCATVKKGIIYTVIH